MQASARPQPFKPAQHVSSSIEEAFSEGCLTTRGYSDSAVPSCRTSIDPKQETPGLSTLPPDDVALSGQQRAKLTALPQHMKSSRRKLQLPSFQSLGISSLLPDALLTPPDESTIVDFAPSLSTSQPAIPRSSSFPQSHLPKTPSPDLTELASAQRDMLSTSQPSNSAQPIASDPAPAEEEHQQGGSESTDSEESDVGPDRDTWLIDAVDAVVNGLPLSTMGPVVNVLCHSQPCPLSTEEELVTTAFPDVIASIQNKISGGGRYIDVIHAVPSKFSMTQIPSSPASTPSARNSVTPPTDYFSMNVFSKAAVAMDYQDALNALVPSSPHPIVAPSSIGVSVLERFLPPSSALEYKDLFSSDAPSVLMDRLVELSPSGGSLIFIYPTALGATTFASRYLGPLLDPLLRTMVGVHGLSTDFGASVGKMPAVDAILPFDGLTRKINVLLRKLNRGTIANMSSSSKYALVNSSSQIVQLDRNVWTDWWTHQEKGRISTVINNYFARAFRLPAREGVTAGALVREILDGVRSRDYADYNLPREGIEVGVFAIRRTA